MKKSEPHKKEKLEGILENLHHDYRHGRFFCSELTIKTSDNYEIRNFYGVVPLDLIGKEIEYESTIMGQGRNRNVQLQDLKMKEGKYRLSSHMLLNDNYNPINRKGKFIWDPR